LHSVCFNKKYFLGENVFSGKHFRFSYIWLRLWKGSQKYFPLFVSYGKSLIFHVGMVVAEMVVVVGRGGGVLVVGGGTKEWAMRA
jgi:hypothetical protein